MATTNDITNDSLITNASTDAYRANWDNIFKKPKQELKEVVHIDILAQPPEQPHVPETKKSVHDVCFECFSLERSHKLDCSSKAVFDAYILLRDTDKWKHFTESMLSTLEFKVWTEQQDRKYSNMFDKEEE